LFWFQEIWADDGGEEKKNERKNGRKGNAGNALTVSWPERRERATVTGCRVKRKFALFTEADD